MKGGDMQVPPDRIVAGTYLCASAATRGKIEIENPPEESLQLSSKYIAKWVDNMNGTVVN